MFISIFTRSQLPTVLPKSLDYGLHVHRQTHSITACKFIFQARLPEYRDTGSTQLDWATGTIYPAASGVDKHHLIFNYSHNTIKIHPLSVRTYGLTCSFQNIADAPNGVDPSYWVVPYLLPHFVHSLSHNCCCSWILLGCHDRCDGVLMVSSLSSRSIDSSQRPSRGVSWNYSPGCCQVLLQLCSITISGQIGHMYIYSEIKIMHAILWCTKPCYCSKDEYNKTKCLVVI
jgi:hypothetical protein